MFLDTGLSYRPGFEGMSREEAVEAALEGSATGKEGLFAIVTNRPLTAPEALSTYRSRNAVEGAFRDLKHGIDWRPARCTSEDAIRGRVLISFLALFSVSLMRFLHPEMRGMTAESVAEDAGSFSVTVFAGEGGRRERVYSNYGRVITLAMGRGWAPEAARPPDRASLDRFMR
jgi:transposase